MLNIFLSYMSLTALYFSGLSLPSTRNMHQHRQLSRVLPQGRLVRRFGFSPHSMRGLHPCRVPLSNARHVMLVRALQVLVASRYDTNYWTLSNGEDGYGYCRQYHWSTSATPNRTFTVFACMPGKHTDVGTLLPTPPSGSSLPTESSNDPSYEDLLRFGGSTFSSTSDTPSSKSETPVGAIVGGAIGGLAVIGAVIVAIFFMFFRSKKQVIEAKSGPGSSTSLSDHEQSVDLLPQQSPIARTWRPSSISYAPPLSGPGFTLPNPRATSTIVSPESEDDSLEQQQQHQPLMSMRGPMSPVNAVPVEIGKAKESPIELAETCGHYELASHPVK